MKAKKDIPAGHLPMTVAHVISDVKLLQWSKWLQVDRGLSTAAKWVSLIFFKTFFLTWTIFKVFIEFVTILLLFYVLVFWPGDMPDLSSLTRNQTHTLCTHCVGRINLFFFFNFLFCNGVWLINKVLVVSGEQWRDSAIHIHVSVFRQATPPIQAGT